ncbi:MAG: glycosyltransferase family 92 protein [Selenomonadaceae bacterium]|nr:glycosyltransferase family 92 protein [Selenomonadaceae bacterium]
MIDKNLFLYDLAVVAIFKNEGRYLKEWLDYHLLAGVDHFYLYNNDSSDDYKEILAPYVEENLVTLTELPGKMMQYPAYNDAIDKYRFECRYMAFIDLDEFIFPKTNQSIVTVVDEILNDIPHAAGLGINWQCFGSNGHETADYSRGVLERFTRRAPRDWSSHIEGGNFQKKVIDNPRLIHCRTNPHFSFYFYGKSDANSNGEYISTWYGNKPILADKIVINHYKTKSKEEYRETKMQRGFATSDINPYNEERFAESDRNEVFDDGILKYRAERAKNFSFESDEQRISRVINSLVKVMTSDELSLEAALTCRAVAEKFQIKIGDQSAEEIALAWIYRTLSKSIHRAEIQMFMKALPQILSRPFPICKEILQLTQNNLLPRFCEALKNGDVLKGDDDWKARAEWLYIQQLLSLIKL